MKTVYSIFNYYVFDVWLLLNFVLFNYNEYGYNVLMCRVWKHVIDYHILYVDHWPMFLLHVLYRLQSHGDDFNLKFSENFSKSFGILFGCHVHNIKIC